MTNPTATPTVAPTDSDHRVAEGPEEATLSASLNGDAAPTVRPVTRADDNADDPSVAEAPATDEHGDATEWPSTLDPNGGASMEWGGGIVGYTICKPRNFETRVR